MTWLPGKGAPASARGAACDTTAATTAPASIAARCQETSLPNANPPSAGTTVVTSRSGRHGPCSSAGMADSLTGTKFTRPASELPRSPQPGMNVLASAKAARSRSGSGNGIQPSSSRTSRCLAAAWLNSLDTMPIAPNPSPSAIVMPGRTRLASSAVCMPSDCAPARPAVTNAMRHNGRYVASPAGSPA